MIRREAEKTIEKIWDEGVAQFPFSFLQGVSLVLRVEKIIIYVCICIQTCTSCQILCALNLFLHWHRLFWVNILSWINNIANFGFSRLVLLYFLNAVLHMYFTETDLTFINFFLIAVERTQERKLEELLLGAAREGETGKLTALVRIQVKWFNP